MKARFYGSADDFVARARRLGNTLSGALREALEEPARTLVRELDQATPPRNREAGEGKIAKDILAVLKGVRGPGSGIDPAVAHRAARGSNGQTRPRVAKVPVNRGRLQRYIRRQVRKAGRAKAGLNPAKRALGLEVPFWLARHGDGLGEFRRQATTGGASITVTMGPSYVSRIRSLAGNLDAIRARTRAHLQAAARAVLERAKAQSDR